MIAVDAAPLPQHLEALANANRVRLARAALKRAVAEGVKTAADVIADTPWEADTMTVYDLLMSQHRWGRNRTRRFLLSFPLTEATVVGALTNRQRREVIDRLKHVTRSVPEVTRAGVVESPTGRMHLQSTAEASIVACGKERNARWLDRPGRAWIGPGVSRCADCRRVATAGCWVVLDD